MSDAAVGRLLVASLHQSIADLLPTRLEFYESWLNPGGLREGRIGLAPLAAVLSFLRLEGEPYHLITARAGEYTAEWAVSDLPAWRMRLIRAAPPAMRKRLVIGVAQWMVRSTYGDTNVRVRWRQWKAAVDLQASLFCEVREPVDHPLCEFLRRSVTASDGALQPRRRRDHRTVPRDRAGPCAMSLVVRPPGGAAAE
jgi:hypothetical protein